MNANGTERGTVFLKWFPYDKRNETIAAALGAECHFICSLKKRTLWNAPFRYLVQTFKTLLLLWRKRPRTILVTNPPVFAAATVALHCAIFGGRFIMDSHSGALAERWRLFQGLHRLVARKAALVVITNETFQEVYSGWGAKTRIISDIVMNIPCCRPVHLSDGFHVMVICSFDPDEPVAEIIAAAAQLPEISFMVTGNFERLAPELIGISTPNVTFTGFLPDDEYFALLHACQAVMVLVDTEDTMQQGAYEAVSVKKPMVLSDWRVLRESYPCGAVFVANEPASIRAGVLSLIEHYDEYVAGAERIHRERVAIWEENCCFLASFCMGTVALKEDRPAPSLDT
ncbi:glycosyltransferase family protein [Geomonas edaphica]|uniref:glycosyltransferase family 4 protein n=1 Tax=Geomonas edaphica TaxID=2570226 RepID=UPI0010A86B93|nr:glycosyltransferase family 4 protein [Geomonas edaphica]